MGNVNLTSGRNLKKIRNDLGIKQDDLKIEGIIKNISELETGAKRVSETVGMALLDRIYQIAKEKNFNFEYDVTLKVITGETNIITNDILKKLSKEKVISKKTLKYIDDNIKELSNDDAIGFIKDVIQILNKDIYENANLIRKYSLKLLNFNLDYDTRIIANQNLIRAYRGLQKYEDAIYIAESMCDDIDKCKDKEIKTSCYGNIAVSYYKEKKLEESSLYYKKLKQLGKGNELFNITLESDIASTSNDFKKAEKGYLNVLEKAIKKCDSDYIANSYSNIADLYMRRDLIDIAIENINRALNSITCGTSKSFKLNVYYNAFLIFGEDDVKIEEFFWKAFNLAIELKNIEKLNILLEKSLSYYIKIDSKEKILDILDKIDDINVDSKILSKFMKIIIK